MGVTRSTITIQCIVGDLQQEPVGQEPAEPEQLVPQEQVPAYAAAEPAVVGVEQELHWFLSASAGLMPPQALDVAAALALVRQVVR
jgi:hypothetical protein